MKKLIRWSLILGAAFSLLGIGIITAGAMMGGMDELAFYFSERGYLDRYGRSAETFAQGADEIAPNTGNGDHSGISSAGQRSGRTMEDGGVLYDEVNVLELTAGAGEVILLESLELADGEVLVKGDGDGNSYEIQKNGEKLEIDLPRDYRGDWKMERLEVTVPTGYAFREVELSVKAGRLEADRLLADMLSVEVSAGEATIRDGYADGIEIEAAAGRVNCQAVTGTNLSVESKTGDVQAVLAGSKKDYDYALECSSGSIILNGENAEEYSELHGERRIVNNTNREVKVECSMGIVVIDYEEGE